jgi:hypothetical protein
MGYRRLREHLIKKSRPFVSAHDVDRTFESSYCQNFGKITPAKYPGSLFCSANCSSGGTRGIFLVSKSAASSESICQSIDAQADRMGASQLGKYIKLKVDH